MSQVDTGQQPGHRSHSRKRPLSLQIMDVGWPELHAPPLDKMCTICKAQESWLNSDPQHVVVIHCRVSSALCTLGACQGVGGLRGVTWGGRRAVFPCVACSVWLCGAESLRAVDGGSQSHSLLSLALAVRTEGRMRAVLSFLCRCDFLREALVQRGMLGWRAGRLSLELQWPVGAGCAVRGG